MTDTRRGAAVEAAARAVAACWNNFPGSGNKAASCRDVLQIIRDRAQSEVARVHHTGEGEDGGRADEELALPGTRDQGQGQECETRGGQAGCAAVAAGAAAAVNGEGGRSAEPVSLLFVDAGVARGAVPALVALLQVLLRGKHPGDRVLVCYAVQLLHCVAGLMHLMDCLVWDEPPLKCNAVPWLAVCLDSPSPCVRVNACKCLGYLVGTGPDMASRIRADEGTVAMLAYFTQQRACTCMSVWEGVRALLHVCCGCTDVYLAGRLLRTLRFMMQVPFGQVFADVCRAVAHLALAVGPEAVHALLDADEAQDTEAAPVKGAVACARQAAAAPLVVPALLSRFGHADPQVVLAAVHASAELAAGQTDGRLQRFVDAGVLSAAAGLLGPGASAHVQQAAYRLLSHIAKGGTLAQVRELMRTVHHCSGPAHRPCVAQSLVQTALATALNADGRVCDGVRGDAIYLVAHLLLREDAGRVLRIRQLVDSKPVSAVMVIAGALGSPEVRVHRAGLSALCGLLVNGRAPTTELSYVDTCTVLGIGRACDLLRGSADECVAQQAHSLYQLWFAGTRNDQTRAPV